MLVTIHNILAPHPLSLFNELGQRRGGQLADVFTRATHRKRHRWSVPWQEVSFQAEMLCTVGIAHDERVFDVSFGSGRTLSSLARRRSLGGCGVAPVSGTPRQLFALGPGVGNTDDQVLGRVITPAARAAFTRRSCAEAYLRGVEIVLPGEASIRQTVSERHTSGAERG